MRLAEVANFVTANFLLIYNFLRKINVNLSEFSPFLQTVVIARKLYSFQYSDSIVQSIFDKLSRNVNPKQTKTFWKRKKEHSEKRDKLAFKPIINFQFSTKIFRKVNTMQTKTFWKRKNHIQRNVIRWLSNQLNIQFSTKWFQKCY